MKVPNTKLEKSIGKDPTKRILLDPYVRITEGKGELVASTGQNGVIIPVEVTEQDCAGPLPIESLKAARKGTGEIELTEQYAIVGGVAYPRAQHLDAFPSIENLIPKEGTVVSLNARLLYETCQALGSDIVRLTIPHSGPIGITPHPSEPCIDGARGMLLPYKVARV